VRYDGGSYQGWEVPIYYDPLVAKLCVWAETRDAAIQRLARVLNEYVVEGISTTLPFFRAVVHSEEFRRGDFDTGFIDRFLNSKKVSLEFRDNDEDTTLKDIAAIAAILHSRASSPRQDSATPAQIESRWKLYGRLAQRK
jgi:acetyl-CoA carboxylase biotin carboxylase subunit